MRKKIQYGQSVVEVVVAMAIFLVIVGSGVVTVLGSLSISKLGNEETQATVLAVEGLEAVTSIRNRDWSDITPGTFGLTNLDGFWDYSGESDIDASGKYTRSVNITSVERDSQGNIVGSGGISDPDTVEVASSVIWNSTGSRQHKVVLTTYLTNWSEAVYESAQEN